MNKLMTVENVDICCGLSWGDEAKGKLVAELLKKSRYDFVCRWSGGSNAGHTVYFNGNKYHTHIIPSGVFYGVYSIIGPDCYLNIEDFMNEISYLNDNGFDTSIVKISPRTHIISNEHKQEDLLKYKEKQGTTGKGIAPCARDKYGRVGKMFKDILEDHMYLKCYLWDEYLYGDILCEGAQGFWLDINYGNYPYITSSTTLPYSACSLGFPPQRIRNIYGAAKIYDTRVGIDPDFPDSLLEDKTLNEIALVGNEFGTTTGRARKVNWLDTDRLVDAINISGCTHIIISKTDVLEQVGKFRILNSDMEYRDLDELQKVINEILMPSCPLLKRIVYSNSADSVKDL